MCQPADDYIMCRSVIINEPAPRGVKAGTPINSEPELSTANLAALQEEILEMENPNFAAQKLKVRELFDGGVPFFTKAAMKDLKAQIEAIRTMVENGRSTDGQKFVCLSITGQTVERAVMKGLTQSRQFGKETVMYVFYPSLIYRDCSAAWNKPPDFNKFTTHLCVIYCRVFPSTCMT